MMPEYLLVMTTVPNAAAARRIADLLVARRLAACVQVVGPIRSTYRWQGRVERAREYLCLVKTTRRRYTELVEAVVGIHPYEVPEIIALPVAAGTPAYLGWLADAVRPSRR